MILINPGSVKRPLIILAMVLFALTVKSQTIVEVVVDQPEILEVTATDGLYTQTDNALILGENLGITGGTGPFRYQWLRNDEVIGTTARIELIAAFISGIYSVMVTDANNCSVRMTATGINDEVAGSFNISVYPVPASKSITINPDKIPGIINATFISSNGKIMLQKKISGVTQLGISFPPGIYFIRFETENGQQLGWRKIVVL